MRSFLLVFSLAFAGSCADSAQGNLGTCHKGTPGCECLMGTCEVGVCSPASNRCVFPDPDGGSTSATDSDSGTASSSGSTGGCPNGDCDTETGGSGSGGSTGSACDPGALDLDPYNCGACGNVCPPVVPGDATPGDCSQGICVPVLSECFEPTPDTETCAAYCESGGNACNEGGCDGRIAVQFDDMPLCGDLSGPVTAAIGCQDPLPAGPGAFRCCCTSP